MRKRTAIFVLAIVLVALVYVFMRDRGESPDPGLGADQTEAIAGVPKAATGPSTELAETLSRLNQPIDFWGQVVDQDGNGVEGVVVTCRLKKGDPILGRGRTDKLTARSDASGRFSFTGQEGFLLSVDSIEKEGYRLASGQDRDVDYLEEEGASISFEYPRRFFLIETGSETALFFDQYSIFSRWEGEPILLDLKKGVVAGGDWDLKIVPVRQTDEPVPNGTTHYDWEISVSSGDGAGIVEASPGAPPTLAPAGGYQGEWSIGYRHDDPSYRGGNDCNFFVRMKDGNYARFHLLTYVSATRTTPNIILRVFINELGGRVLEGESTNSRY